MRKLGAIRDTPVCVDPRCRTSYQIIRPNPVRHVRSYSSLAIVTIVKGSRYRQLCVRDFDISIVTWLSLRTSFPNANCLGISNEPLKYWTQWLRPPEAKAAGTHARNVVVNEGPSGRSRRVGEVEPR